MHADGRGDEQLVPAGDDPGHGAHPTQGAPMAPRLRHSLLLPPAPPSPAYSSHHNNYYTLSLHSSPHPLPHRYHQSSGI